MLTEISRVLVDNFYQPIINYTHKKIGIDNWRISILASRIGMFFCLCLITHAVYHITNNNWQYVLAACIINLIYILIFIFLNRRTRKLMYQPNGHERALDNDYAKMFGIISIFITSFKINDIMESLMLGENYKIIYQLLVLFQMLCFNFTIYSRFCKNAGE